MIKYAGAHAHVQLGKNDLDKPFSLFTLKLEVDTTNRPISLSFRCVPRAIQFLSAPYLVPTQGHMKLFINYHTGHGLSISHLKSGFHLPFP